MSNVANGAAINFGQTWSGVTDLTMPSVMVSGNRAIAEMLVKRYTTPRGRLLSDPNFGLDLTQYLNAPLTSGQLSQLASQCNKEATKDERVLSAQINLTFVLGTLTVSGTIQTANGPFQLVISIAQLTVALLQVTPS